jgi:hypothetical protein
VLLLVPNTKTNYEDKKKMRESEERETVGKEGSARANFKHKKSFFHHLDKVTTPFFITNFPDDVTTGDLWDLYRKYGRVGEVYLPKKLDKRGRWFGFVKFKEVEDVNALCESLKNVWLGSFKLWVNRSRFGRSDNADANTSQAQSQRFDPNLGVTTPGRSFRSALAGGVPPPAVPILKVPVNEDLCRELRGSVVGTLARENDVRRIQIVLFMEGYSSIVVSHMGGNMALLRSPMAGDVERLLKSKKECLKYFFSEIKPWNPGLLAVQRETWVQVYGIPVHIWGENLFKLIGNRFGAFLDFDEETARMVRFDVARIKILTSTGALINTVLKIEVEGVCFNLWLVEERGKRKPLVVLRDAMEDEGSEAARVDISDGGNGGSVGVNGGDQMSREDEVSGEEECEVDVRRIVQHEEGHEVNCVAKRSEQFSDLCEVNKPF